MTRFLFWEDSYRREFDARVTWTDGAETILDATCFFASSGGQPSDTGKLNDWAVTDVRRVGNDVLHTLQNGVQFRAGDTVRGVIDWDRRYRIMRLHSACHVMSGVLLKEFDVRKHTGIQIYDDRARMDFDMEKLDQTTVEEIEAAANRIVTEGHEISAKITSWDYVEAEPALKTVSGERYDRSSVPRILEIAGLDRQLDGGTHVRNTREIGRIRIVKRENKGRSNKRIVLVVE